MPWGVAVLAAPLLFFPYVTRIIVIFRESPYFTEKHHES